MLKANFTWMTVQYIISHSELAYLDQRWEAMFGELMPRYVRPWQPVHLNQVTYSQTFLEKQAYLQRRTCHTSLFNTVKGDMISTLTLVTQCFHSLIYAHIQTQHSICAPLVYGSRASLQPERTLLTWLFHKSIKYHSESLGSCITWKATSVDRWSLIWDRRE